MDADGTIDGVTFNQKFGRRNFKNVELSNSEFHEDLTDELLKQCESIETYGGFYISSFDISKGANGKPQSKQGKMPWVKVDFLTAKEIASSFENSSVLKSHLPYGAEMDSMYSWFIKSEARTYYEVVEDSTIMGNHWNSENSPHEVIETGSREGWFTNGIADPTGNVEEWTQEHHVGSRRVFRGACSNNFGFNYSTVFRCRRFSNENSYKTGFRIALYISSTANCTYIGQ